MTRSKVVVVESKEAVISELVNKIELSANQQIQKGLNFYIGVSGGSLVDFLVIGLPKVKTDFSKWKIFFCDERVVPEDDPESTFGVYKKKLIDTKVVDLKADQFVTIKQGVSAEEAAIDYDHKIKQHFSGANLPRFDILLLGMGPDGHTCSLFPGHKLLNETSLWVAPITDSPKPPPSRVTLTFPVINNAKVCLFAISGEGKADMVKRILKDNEDLPAGRVQPVSDQLYWILDKGAAALI